MERLQQLIQNLYEKINSKDLALDDNKVIINSEALKLFLQQQSHLNSLLKVKLPNTNKSIFDNEKILLYLVSFDKNIFNLDNEDNEDKYLIICNQINDRLYNLKNQIETTYPGLITNQDMCRN